MSDRRMDIVVVEDDLSMRQAMQRMLQAAGYAVRPYESAEALLAIGLDQARQCDCLVLDFRMPGISGLELFRTLSLSGLCPPCILITAQDAPGLRKLAIGAGVRDYLLKPFTGTALLKTIVQAVAA